MIHYDVTKMGESRHRSGLTRVSSRLREALGAAAHPVRWRAGAFRDAAGAPVAFRPDDWLLTVEVFADGERPGFREFVAARPCRLGAVYHDAIPLKLPHVTWPQSVRRHPAYLKLLSGFDRVWAISDQSRDELLGFWRWQGVAARAAVGRIELGADFDGAARAREDAVPAGRPLLLCVGIVEPRKNQGFLVDVAEALWAAGADFDLHVVGRVNPHFGAPLERRLRGAARRERRLRFHGAAGDAVLAGLYRTARAVVFPTRAEGCGLPVIEALWRGAPCVCSDLPVLRELTAGGGCLTAAVDDRAAWVGVLGRVLSDGATAARLRAEAVRRPLPTWAEAATALRRDLAAG